MEWIAVGTALPPKAGDYLVSDGYRIHIGSFHVSGAWQGIYDQRHVRYWMPLPAAPEMSDAEPTPRTPSPRRAARRAHKRKTKR